jgi:hypothetical protein
MVNIRRASTIQCGNGFPDDAKAAPKRPLYRAFWQIYYWAHAFSNPAASVRITWRFIGAVQMKNDLFV